MIKKLQNLVIILIATLILSSCANKSVKNEISDIIQSSEEYSSEYKQVVDISEDASNKSKGESRLESKSTSVISMTSKGESKIPDTIIKALPYPTIIKDQFGGNSFAANGKQYVVWGVEDDQWLSAAGSVSMINKYVEASKYVNANTLAVHSPWKLIEREKGVYDFTVLQYYLEKVEAAGLKTIIYFTGIDYAAGNMEFVPEYIVNDNETYTKVGGNSKFFRNAPWGTQPSLPACPSDADTLAREKKAYLELVKFIKGFDTNKNVLAIQIGGEMNYLMGLNDAYWGLKNTDIRCECTNCNTAYAKFTGTNLAFMTNQFAKYIKAVIDEGATVYDLPTYTCSAPFEYWNKDWRYAENSPVRKQIVNKANYFVGPSIAETKDIATYTKEMNHYLDANIKGNYIFTSGIDTGHGTPGSPDNALNSWLHLEMAAWFNIFYYKSLGAIYWDHPKVSITNETTGAPVREKLRAMWSPLRGISSILAKYKAAPENTLLWWNYDELSKDGVLGSFTTNIIQNQKKNYGFAISLKANDVIFSASTYEQGVTTIKLTVSDSLDGFKYERGCFDANENWISKSTFSPSISGKSITVIINGDNGDATNSIFRIYK